MDIRVTKPDKYGTVKINVFYTDSEGKEKKQAVPCEYCSVDYLNNPSEASVAYWNVFGIDRKKDITDALFTEED